MLLLDAAATPARVGFCYAMRCSWLDRTAGSPAENLALDEALLVTWDQQSPPSACLRIWESPTYFVVMGLSGRTGAEVNSEECERRKIPVLRRISGGGTVVQGPGCLNYALVAPLDANPVFSSVSASYEWILGRIVAQFPALQRSGMSDLCWEGRKVSGNAQKRSRRALLHHGTVLYDFDISLLSKLLPHPPREPAYRERRGHSEFVANLPLSREEIVGGLRAALGATKSLKASELPTVTACSVNKYERDAWNRRI